MPWNKEGRSYQNRLQRRQLERREKENEDMAKEKNDMKKELEDTRNILAGAPWLHLAGLGFW